MSSRKVDAILIIGAIALGLGLKQFFSTANVGELRWILSPTVHLVALITGAHFELESGSGYLSREHGFLVAPVCAGVNFLVIAYWTLIFSRLATTRRKLALFFGCIPVAYAITVIANAARICLAMSIREQHLSLFGLSPIAMHEAVGVLVYLGALIVIVTTTRSPKIWAAIACYLAVTIGIPLANGAGSRTGFAHHAGLVIALSIGVAIVAHLTATARSRLLSGS